MKNDLGFLILELDNSPYYHSILNEIYQLIKYYPYHQICVFNAYSEKIDSCRVPVMPISHAKFFKGDIFVFDIVSLMMVKDFPNIDNKYYFAQSSDWVDQYNNYFLWKSLFLQNKLNIITSNNILYDIYNICWKQPIGIMEKFSSKELINVIR